MSSIKSKKLVCTKDAIDHLSKSTDFMLYQYKLDIKTGKAFFEYCSDRCKDIYELSPEEVYQDSESLINVCNNENKTVGIFLMLLLQFRFARDTKGS